jgi:hypothetical protein
MSVLRKIVRDLKTENLNLNSENTQLKVINTRDHGFVGRDSVPIDEHETTLKDLRSSRTEVLKF